jgi:hypothetical protein
MKACQGARLWCAAWMNSGPSTDISKTRSNEVTGNGESYIMS